MSEIKKEILSKVVVYFKQTVMSFVNPSQQKENE